MTESNTDSERTIGDAKSELEGLEGRIGMLEEIGADQDHIEDLREQRDELRERIDVSEERARTKNAIANAFGFQPSD